MYLRECLIENVGPIEFFDVSLELAENGTPKPLILVGENGSGKSIVLSYIADALVEFAKIDFIDVVQGQQALSTPYFRWILGTNQRSNAPFGICLLEFVNDTARHSYVDKSGTLDPASFTAKLKGRFLGAEQWDIQKNDKKTFSNDAEERKNFFERGAVVYFPPSRKENPHWLNVESISSPLAINSSQKLDRHLRKPIFVESSAEKNKSWLLDVFLDSLVDVEAGPSGLEVSSNTNIRDKLLLRRGRKNIEEVLQQILQDETAELSTSYRHNPAFRLSVTIRNGQIIIPSLDNLSSGQAILFNVFATIIRYADMNDPNKSIQLQNIEGLVLIDEIDAHLHSNLQYHVLPRLLKLFPKVQFVLTSHSPLFLLGMKEVYGDLGFQAIEMPTGTPITIERFSEFLHSFNYYRATKAFEDAIKIAIDQEGKPLVFTEGETDPKYIKTGLALLGRDDLLEQIDIEWVGHKENGQATHTGYKALDDTFALAKAKPDLFKRKLLLLYDFDTNKHDQDMGNVTVRSIPRNANNTKVRRGIENLFAEQLFEARFYRSRLQVGHYGEQTNIGEFQKMEFCRELCDQKQDPTDFQGFSVIAEIIDRWLDRRAANEVPTEDTNGSVE